MAETKKSSMLPKAAGRTLIFAVLIGIVGIVLMTLYFRSRNTSIVMTLLWKNSDIFAI